MGSCLSSNGEDSENYAPPQNPSSFTYTRAVTTYSVGPSIPITQRAYGLEEICFGKFRCGVCRHQWASYRAWKTVEQKCEHCHVSTRPHFTRPLTREEKEKKTKDPDKAHKAELCLKCQKIGGNCKQLSGKKYRYL